MQYIITTTSLILFIASITGVVLALTAWQRRYTPGATSFAGLMLAAALWAAGSALEYAAVDQATQILWAKIQYTGIVSTGVLWLLFCLDYTQVEPRLPGWGVGLLWVIPLLTLGVVWTNELHGMLWSRVTPIAGTNRLIFGHGSWFYIIVAYSYLLLLAGALTLFYALARFPSRFRQQAGALIIGVAIPWIANAIYILNPLIFNGVDPTPVAFVLTGLVYAISVFRFRLLELTLIAQDELVESLADGIIVIDRQGRVSLINPAARALTGLHDITGQPFSQGLAPIPDLVSRLQAGRLIPGGERLTVEIMQVDTEQRIIDLLIVPLERRRSRGGRLVVLHDITQRRRAEEQLQLQSIALESAANAIIITNTEGRITWVNQAFTHITGYSAEEAIGQTTALLRSGRHDRDFYAEMWNTVMNGQVWHGEITNRRKDGSLYYEEQTISPVRSPDGQITHFIAVKQDITDRRQVEQMRDDLMSVIVHDLRNPLASILTSLDLFPQIATGIALPPEAMEMLQIGRANARRMLGMVNAILDMRKLESGNMTVRREQIILAELVEEACRHQSPLANRSEVLLLNDVPYELPPVAGDSLLLFRVFQNLLDNAIKYTSPGGNVEITARLALEANLVEVAIRDGGPGIDPEVQQRLFQKFVSDPRLRRGFGLGLVFCRMAVEAHGGEIWAESESGQGTTFHFTLPVLPYLPVETEVMTADVEA